MSCKPLSIFHRISSLRFLLRIVEVQRSQGAGSAMLLFQIWLSRQHQITNGGQGGVVGKEDVDEEL